MPSGLVVEPVPAPILFSTVELAAVVLLYVALAAACLWGAWRRPRAGRVAAIVVTAALALGTLAVAGVFFVEAGAPEHEGTFGAEAIGLVGSMILMGGFFVAGMAVVIHRGGEVGRGLVAAVLAFLGFSAVQWTVTELAKEGAARGASLAIVALMGFCECAVPRFWLADRTSSAARGAAALLRPGRACAERHCFPGIHPPLTPSAGVGAGRPGQG